ncbi:hypothetical protein RRG08_017676 [Elysia crispata]|uniref:Uncharacterized protein n=1 Tax=Elysia crispata TaxID=231223 RepID=A0AAE0ZBK3_9GAST|nr:hypothetical protein RRG08_017676 [Elysia crispata]
MSRARQINQTLQQTRHGMASYVRILPPIVPDTTTWSRWSPCGQRTDCPLDLVAPGYVQKSCRTDYRHAGTDLATF